MACYYIVISSTHLSNGHFRNIKGVFRGPLNKNGSKNLDYSQKERTMAEALGDLKANFYCELCDKQYYKHQEFDNHINSYDHAHKQRLKELKQREFARNVSSKSKKDGRKQERALRRLHELAEQRLEGQRVPGSGPMFRSTTVAVEGGYREARGDRASSRAQNSTQEHTMCPNVTLDTLADNTSTIQAQQTPSTVAGKCGQKISFSFPKKASLKLESSAAVFCQAGEDGSSRHACRQRLSVQLNSPRPPTGLDSPSPPASEKALHNKGKIHIAGSQVQGLTNAPPGSDSSMPPADLCTILVYSEDVAFPCTVQSSMFLSHSNTLDDCELDMVQGSLKSNLAEQRQETELEKGQRTEPDKIMLADNVSHKGGHPLSNCANHSNEAIYTQPQDKDLRVSEDEKWTVARPCKPFHSILSRNGKTVLQWPSEMLTFTRTSPSISFSCNPLHFDFRASTKDAGCRVVERDVEKSAELAKKSYSDEATLETRELFKSLPSPERILVQEDCERPKSHGCEEPSNTLIRKDEQCCNYSAQLATTSLTHTAMAVDTRRCCSTSQRRRRRQGHRRMTHQGGDRYEGATERFGNCLTLPNHCERLDDQISDSSAKKIQPDEPKQSPSIEGNEGRIEAYRDTAGVVRQALAECVNGTAASLAHSDEALQGPGQINEGNMRNQQSKHINAIEHTSLNCGSLQTNPVITSADQTNKIYPTLLKHQPLPESLLQEGGRCRKRTMDDQTVGSTCVNSLHKPNKRRRRRRRACGAHQSSVADVSCGERYEQSRGANGISPCTGSDSPGPEDKLNPDALEKSIDSVNVRSSCKGQINGSDLKRYIFDSGAKGSDVIVAHKSVMSPDQPNFHSKSDGSCKVFLPIGNGKMSETLNASYTKLEQESFNSKDCYRSTLDRLEKHCLQHLQAHRKAMDYQTFPDKLKPVLASPHIPVSSPIVLHPVQLPLPLSTSITIHQTFLQHHADFLQPQPLLMSPILPFTHLPLGAEVCSHSHSPFIYQDPISVMARPSLHPMTMSFHPLPRTMFPHIFPQHHTVIPLQPLF
nr:zinc finger protein 804A-like [Oncorhynchus nerka]